ncbi:MAG: hypothetical protein ABI068_03270, partial [Ktedonobacterales bacterium]
TVQLDRCEQLQSQRERMRSATLFPWWPRRIKKRQGPRRTLYKTYVVGLDGHVYATGELPVVAAPHS